MKRLILGAAAAAAAAGGIEDVQAQAPATPHPYKNADGDSRGEFFDAFIARIQASEGLGGPLGIDAKNDKVEELAGKADDFWKAYADQVKAGIVAAASDSDKANNVHTDRAADAVDAYTKSEDLPTASTALQLLKLLRAEEVKSTVADDNGGNSVNSDPSALPGRTEPAVAEDETNTAIPGTDLNETPGAPGATGDEFDALSAAAGTAPSSTEKPESVEAARLLCQMVAEMCLYGDQARIRLQLDRDRITWFTNNKNNGVNGEVKMDDDFLAELEKRAAAAIDTTLDESAGEDEFGTAFTPQIFKDRNAVFNAIFPKIDVDTDGTVTIPSDVTITPSKKGGKPTITAAGETTFTFTDVWNTSHPDNQLK